LFFFSYSLKHRKVLWHICYPSSSLPSLCI
jgi:hypothetical protein